MSACPESSRVTCWLLKKPYRRKNGTLVWRFRYHQPQPDGTLRQRQESIPQSVASSRGDRRQALRYMWRREEQLNARGESFLAVPRRGSVTIAQAVERYKAHMTKHLRPRTLYEKGLLLDRFAKSVGGQTPVASITGEMVAAYLDGRLADGVRASTYNKDLRDLRAFFQKLIKPLQYLQRNPCLGLEDLDPAETDTEPIARPILSDAQAARFVRTALEMTAKERPVGKWLRIDALAVWALAETGMRLTELLTRRWDHLHRLPADGEGDLARTVIILGSRETKGKRDRVTPVLSDGLSTELDIYRTEVCLEERRTGYVFRPWREAKNEIRQCGISKSRQRVRDFLRAVCREAGLSEITPHALRRTFATTLETLGLDSDAIQRTGGWAGRKVLEDHYIDPAALNKRAVDEARQVANARNFGALVVRGERSAT